MDKVKKILLIMIYTFIGGVFLGNARKLSNELVDSLLAKE